jgi:cytochrome c-type biogenesis protein
LVTVGDMAPDFTARTLQGEIFTLSEERGNVVLVVLFSHTCPDCKALFNDIVSRIDDIEASGVRMIAVSRGGTQHEIEEYMLTNGYTFDVIADSSAEIYKLYATTYVPRTYLVDRDGVIRYTTIEYNATYVDDIIQQISHL